MLKKLSITLLMLSFFMLFGCKISGTVTNESLEGVMDVTMSFGAGGSTTTDEEGNYWSLDILPGQYTVIPLKEGYTFEPSSRTVTTLDFILGNTTNVDFVGTLTAYRFTDMGDGTVRDNDSGLIWLKVANALGNANWDNAMTAAAGLDAGDFAWLTDGSEEGDWGLPTREDWEAFIDTNYLSPVLSNAVGDGQWSEGDAFIGVHTEAYHWSSTETAGGAWSVGMRNGFMMNLAKGAGSIVWPVRSDN